MRACLFHGAAGQDLRACPGRWSGAGRLRPGRARRDHPPGAVVRARRPGWSRAGSALGPGPAGASSGAEAGWHRLVSLGSGFRGGLFFASLFLGALLGKAFAGSLAAYVSPAPAADPTIAILVGMSSLAVACRRRSADDDLPGAGRPPATSPLTIVVPWPLRRVSILVRETFGYSFSTWRFPLRGDTIRSAHDVGWMRTWRSSG